MNDEDREAWCDSDEGLYNLKRASGLSAREFVRANRKMIDEVIDNVNSKKKPTHYLAYPTRR